MPATKNLLDKVFNEYISNEEKSTTITKMATATGNCATPIKSLLIHELVWMSHEGTLSESEPLIPMLKEKLLKTKY